MGSHDAYAHKELPYLLKNPNLIDNLSIKYTQEIFLLLLKRKSTKQP